jgi:hypothetical protein
MRQEGSLLLRSGLDLMHTHKGIIRSHIRSLTLLRRRHNNVSSLYERRDIFMENSAPSKYKKQFSKCLYMLTNPLEERKLFFWVMCNLKVSN